MLETLAAGITGEIGDEELAALRIRPTYPQLKRISERHHAVARMLASGHSLEETARTCGYTMQMLRVLRANPAFMDLMETYKDQIDEQFVDLARRLAVLSADAVQIVQDRLEEEPEKVTTGQLLEIIKVGADRSGFGPSSTVQHDIGSNLAARLEAARLRARSAMQIEGTATEVAAE